jgi:flagellar biosynthesis/type III secretory pathway protein FliH
MSLRSVLAPLAASAVLLGPASALAQPPAWRLPSDTAVNRSLDDAPISYPEIRRVAYDEGYREGLKRGEQDGRRGARFAYQDEREFQRGDKGYHRNYGDRERYRQIFRDGYVSGYQNGYARYSRAGGYNGPYSQGPYGRPQGPYVQQGGNYGGYGGYGGGYYTPAFDNGSRDGYEKGQEDARKNRSYDPLRHSWYRAGDRHYEGRYGSREQYKDVYRRGFQEGYERGYRDGRYRW